MLPVTLTPRRADHSLPPIDRIEATVQDLLTRLLPPRSVASGRGRPPILPAMVLWSGLLVGILRGQPSQAHLWRRITQTGLWDHPRVPVSDDAIRQRLLRDGPTVLARLFADATAELLATTAPRRTLASFATDIVAIDETTLDPIARLLPGLRDVRRGDVQLLPGRFAGVFDIRRQLWRTLQLRQDPVQNEKVAAPDLVATLAPGTLVLADLGYFGFAWFDGLTERELWWVSRLRAKTSYAVQHVHGEADEGDTLDALIWLGAHRSDKAGHLVRLVQYQHGGQLRRYVTNVLDPAQLSLAEIIELYGRRWDIERAVKLIKRDLKLHLVASARWELIQTQVWAVLLIAQIALGLRRQIAGAAGVDDFDVSLTLLLRDLPELVRSGVTGDDVIEWLVRHGPAAGYIRPSRRLVRVLPALREWEPPPSALERTRPFRYAGRKCGPKQTDRRPGPALTRN